MSSTQARLELWIDVLDLAGQRALALPTMRPHELVAAVLEEFRELEFLGDNPAEYQLIKADDRAPLADEPLDQQLKPGARLALTERVAALPGGAQRASAPAYLRDQDTGQVYRLDWHPAIIGRPDSSRQDNDRLAVNLSAQAGLRVSRRQAQIVERGGQFYVEPLADNPTAVRDGQGATTPVSQRHLLQHGDVIVFERSQVALKFIVRTKEPAI